MDRIDDLDISQVNIREPERRPNKVTFCINHFINSLNNNNNFKFLILEVTKVIHLDLLVSNLKPIAKILPEFFLIKLDFLINI